MSVKRIRAGNRLVICVWLAGTGNASAADAAPTIRADNAAGAYPSDDGSYGAIFNPFATVGIPVRQPPKVEPDPQGDWALPLVAALLGVVCICALLRKLLD